MLREVISTAAVGIAATAVIFGGIAAADAASIGINFRGNNNVDLGAAESAGAPTYSQTNWNNFDKYGGDFTNTTIGGSSVIDNTGTTVTGVRADFDAQNKYHSGSNTGTPNGKLMDGYQDSNGNANSGTSLNNEQNRPYLGIFNLSTDYTAGGYNVIVYTDGDTTGRGGKFWIETANYTDTTRDQSGATISPVYFAKDPGNFDSTGFVQVTSTDQANPTSGNYIVFSNLTASSFVLRADELYSESVDGPKRVPINAVQIVAVPEPATLGLIGVVGAGLLARRRRNA